MKNPILKLLPLVVLCACATSTYGSKNVVSNLGTKENPIKADMPMGQRAYLNRLRCADNNPPSYYRVGNVGFGVFGHIVDLYDVTCKNSAPESSKLYMDMYFPNYFETNAPQGFTLVN